MISSQTEMKDSLLAPREGRDKDLGTPSYHPPTYLRWLSGGTAVVVLLVIGPVGRHRHSGRAPAPGGPVRTAPFTTQELIQVQGLTLLLASFFP